MTMVKTIGTSGQVSLGKQYAGKHVLIDEIEPGVWMIKVGEFVPDNERWMTHPETKEEIDKAIEWAEENKPAETNLETLSRKIK